MRLRAKFAWLVGGMLSVPAWLPAERLADAPVPVVVTRAVSDSHLAEGRAALGILRAPAAMPVRDTGFHLYDWGLLGAFGVLRFLDYRTTEKCQSDPANFKETELPQALVSSKPGLAAFESGTVVLNYYVYRWFLRHHHRSLAHVGQYINIGTIGYTVGMNYYYLDRYYQPYPPASLRAKGANPAGTQRAAPKAR